MRLAKVLGASVALVMTGGVGAAIAKTPGHHPAAGDRVNYAAHIDASLAGLQRPAPAVPVGAGAGPARPAATTAPSAGGRGSGSALTGDLPVPATGSLPAIAPLGPTHDPDAVVMLRSPLTAGQTTGLRQLNGVAAIEVVDTGTVSLSGAQAVTFGVDPSTFRSFAPAASATATRLWQYLAAGSLVSSYEMAADRRLQLGAEDQILPAGSAGPAPSGRGTVRGWMGAFASIGLPGVDLLVDHAYSNRLGLTPDTGLVVSAPTMTGANLQAALQRVLPGAAVELLHADQIPQFSGNQLGSSQRSQLISAALSRVGLPYVWGAAGPDSFDCSGLVQWSYARAGVLMPRTAAEQFLTGIHIPLAQAAPGDLLFWTYDPNDPGFVDHTAIYVGDGMMVVAPHTGLDVQVVPVPTGDFAGALRVVLQPR